MFYSVSFCVLLLAVMQKVVDSAESVSLRTVGGVFCEENSGNKYKAKCAPQKCAWKDWYNEHYEQEDKPVERVVLSYGHCGFGNQIFQHNFAQMTAEQTGAAFYASKIPNSLVTGGLHWAESKAGYLNAKPMIDPKLLWENLPANHSAKVLCSKYNVTIGYRPVDRRKPRPEWNTNYKEFIDPKGPAKCLVMIGFFQQYIPCLNMRQNMWRGVYENQRYDTFSPSDMVVHMRCLGGHYPPPNKIYIEAVLNNTKYDKLYIFKPPGPCRNRGKGTVFDNTYILDMLVKRYGAEYYNRPNASGLTDFLDLSSAYQVIETASTYSFWSGMFSNQNATIHVDTSFHRVVPDDHRFIYHDPHTKRFYGQYSVREQKIKFRITGSAIIRELVRSKQSEREVLRGNQTKGVGRVNRKKDSGAENSTLSTRLAQLGTTPSLPSSSSSLTKQDVLAAAQAEERRDRMRRRQLSVVTNKITPSTPYGERPPHVKRERKTYPETLKRNGPPHYRSSSSQNPSPGAGAGGSPGSSPGEDRERGRQLSVVTNKITPSTPYGERPPHVKRERKTYPETLKRNGPQRYRSRSSQNPYPGGSPDENKGRQRV